MNTWSREQKVRMREIDKIGESIVDLFILPFWRDFNFCCRLRSLECRMRE